MIFSKLWNAFAAQMNKIANFFWTADPIAQMQYEYDKAVEQLKEGRQGLEQYRALVERVSRQVENDKKHVAQLEAKVKTYLQVGDRTTAGKFALEMTKAKEQLKENLTQLEMHEKAYENNLTKIKHASHKLGDLKDKIHKYDADLKMSKAEAELASIAHSMNVDITTDFGQIEQVVQDRISLNRGKARVAADLSSEGLAEVQAEQAMEQTMAEQALREFEVDMGIATPQTSAIGETAKELGPAKQVEKN